MAERGEAMMPCVTLFHSSGTFDSEVFVDALITSIGVVFASFVNELSTHPTTPLMNQHAPKRKKDGANGEQGKERRRGRTGDVEMLNVLQSTDARGESADGIIAQIEDLQVDHLIETLNTRSIREEDKGEPREGEREREKGGEGVPLGRENIPLFER